MSTTKKTLKGPRGVTLVLDPEQIFADDPGQGTPAMVYYKGGSATYWCAVHEGEVIKGWDAIELPLIVIDWLDKQLPKVTALWDAVADYYIKGGK